MSSDHPSREHPNTYFVQDRSNKEEMTRLHIQDQMLTAGMGGVLPEQTDPTRFQRILDVGCGTGDWLIEVARTYPTLPMLVGVDVSKKMLEFARAQAAQQQVSERIEFHVMDALRMLEFPSASFDLVNHRFGTSFLRTWDWPKLLAEYRRVARAEGIIRVTECDMVAGNTPAHARLCTLLRQALIGGGHFFPPATPGDTGGLIHELAGLLEQHGLSNVQTCQHILEYRAGTPEGQSLYEDAKHIFRTLLPFLRKWNRMPDDYEEIYQQALNEMQQPDFVATWTLLTAWGSNE